MGTMTDQTTTIPNAHVSPPSPHPTHENIQAIARLEEQVLQRRTGADRVAAGITRAAGSMAFAWVHVAWYAGWVCVNLGLVPGVPVFDPYPFNFLTLVVSLEAIFLSLFVLNSQNRMTREADRRRAGEHEDPRDAPADLPAPWTSHHGGRRAPQAQRANRRRSARHRARPTAARRAAVTRTRRPRRALAERR